MPVCPARPGIRPLRIMTTMERSGITRQVRGNLLSRDLGVEGRETPLRSSDAIAERNAYNHLDRVIDRDTLLRLAAGAALGG